MFAQNYISILIQYVCYVMKVKQYEVRMEMEVSGIASYSMLLLLTMQCDDGRRDARYMRQKVCNLWLCGYPSLKYLIPVLHCMSIHCIQ